jgi:hypothetical protein
MFTKCCFKFDAKGIRQVVIGTNGGKREMWEIARFALLMNFEVDTEYT